MVALATKFAGLHMNTSKQSIMTMTFVLKCFLKLSGVVSHNWSLSGHLIRGLILTNMTSNHLRNTVDTVVLLTANL